MANYVIVTRSLVTKAGQTAKCPSVFHIFVDFSSMGKEQKYPNYHFPEFSVPKQNVHSS